MASDGLYVLPSRKSSVALVMEVVLNDSTGFVVVQTYKGQLNFYHLRKGQVL